MEEISNYLDLYYLKMHECVFIKDFFITRVPGGFIYEQRIVKYYPDGNAVVRGSAVFVPKEKK